MIEVFHIWSVIKQKGESQNGCFKKTKHAKFSVKRTFVTSWHAHVRWRPLFSLNTRFEIRPLAILPTNCLYQLVFLSCLTLSEKGRHKRIWAFLGVYPRKNLQTINLSTNWTKETLQQKIIYIMILKLTAEATIVNGLFLTPEKLRHSTSIHTEKQRNTKTFCRTSNILQNNTWKLWNFFPKKGNAEKHLENWGWPLLTNQSNKMWVINYKQQNWLFLIALNS